MSNFSNVGASPTANPLQVHTQPSENYLDTERDHQEQSPNSFDAEIMQAFQEDLKKTIDHLLLDSEVSEDSVMIDDVFAMPPTDERITDHYIEPVLQKEVSNDELIDIDSIDNDIIQALLKLISDNQTPDNNPAAMTDALSEYINALITEQAQQRQDDIYTDGTVDEALLTEQNIALRNHYLTLMEQFEQYTLDQAVQEQIKNMLFNMTFNQAQNLFSLAKTVVNAAKY